MSKHKGLAILLFQFLALQQIFCASVSFADEERSYIATRPPVRAVSVDGSGPIQYTDSKGVVRGVARRVLDEVSKRSALVFEYRLLDQLTQLAEVYDDGSEIIFGIPDQYARPGYKLSEPFLRTQTILFANKAVDSHALEDKRFAATHSSALPQGISEDQAIYYQTREEAIRAFNEGKADFGYGNAYSVAFYTLQHGFQEIYTVPQGKEERSYRLLFINYDPLMVSILEKALSSFTKQELQAITLILMAFLLGALAFVQTSRRRLSLEKMKFRTIAEVSNEYLFECDTHDKALVPYKKLKDLLATPQALQEASNALLSYLDRQPSDEASPVMTLVLGSGERGSFRISASRVAQRRNGQVSHRRAPQDQEGL
ncbi:MAG: transporter substrate-binding domain-containing protein [Sphaerochaeta sp.]|nr:transporter substrate-binding domain-containing protein [Sphaerochaeta sp.]